MLDSLTGIYSETGINTSYEKYLEQYPNANFIMIDLKLFKLFNDNYGHDMGDRVLKIFAELLSNYFKGSVVARLHGDEYALITDASEREIEERFSRIENDIERVVASGNLPQKFEFNGGVSKATPNMKETREKADYMMYNAKKKSHVFQGYDEALWKRKQKVDKFLQNVAMDLSDHTLTYCERDIVDNRGGEVISEITTRDSKGESIFSEENYEILRENSLLRKIDLYNLEYLFSELAKMPNKERVLLNIDYKSLLFKDDLLGYIKVLVEKTHVSPSQIILSINVNDIKTNLYPRIIDTANSLKTLGFGLCLDNYSSIAPDKIVESVNIDYIKFDYDYWKNSKDNVRARSLIAAKIKLYGDVAGIEPIFTCISDKKDYEYARILASECSTPVHLSGNYIAREEQVVKRK